MIKKFNEYINEDYFSKLASRKDNGDVRKENEITEDYIMSFCYAHVVINSVTFRKENGETVVDIDGNYIFSINSFNNSGVGSIKELGFQFGKITGNFSISNCESLKSLEGCPREVTGYFNCCCNDNLTSLEGCPEKVGGIFKCNECEKLISLEGCPKEVGSDFNCWKCGRQFTTDEVKSLCNVKGKIVVK